MNISGDTPVYAVLGSPIAHSLSPVLHNFWMAQHGLAGVYVAMEPQPEAFSGLAGWGLGGCNVTAPFKELAARTAPRITAEAHALAAVNTFFRDDAGAWTGTNTDAAGFALGLDDASANWRRSTGLVLVVGAGGAARAIVHGLEQAVAPDIAIFNRSTANAERAAALSEDAEAVSWNRALELAQDADLIINTLPPHADFPELLTLAQRAHGGAVFCDITYRPRRTPFLASREKLTLFPGVDGLHMLVGQGALAFQHWFGVAPDRAAGRRRLLQALGETDA
ncbi:MAG: shikimate dehydrogenase [Hyphomonadaceae bacterium]|nr:shikimate dehydrogenase [Hyphomonadaceae bacterium]